MKITPGKQLYGGMGFVKLLDVMGSDESIERAARISYGTGTRKTSETRSLIRYLVRHRHTSPLEQGVLQFHMRIPIFVMRQHVRHRTASINEYSGRYSEMIDYSFVPEFQDIKPQSVENKQGRSETSEKEFNEFELQTLMAESIEASHETYQKLLEQNVSRELARIVLPVANYTECVWKIDLHNFCHYLKLRTDSHAQKEIRDLANAMYELAKPHFPLVFEAWEDYSKNAYNLSRMEKELIVSICREYFQNRTVTELSIQAHGSGMSQREWKEFYDNFIRN